MRIFRFKEMITKDQKLQINFQSGKNICFSLIDINNIYIEFNTRWRLQLFLISIVLVGSNGIIFYNFIFPIFIVSSIVSILFYNYLLFNNYKYKLIIKLKNNTLTAIDIPKHSKKVVSTNIIYLRSLLNEKTSQDINRVI